MTDTFSCCALMTIAHLRILGRVCVFGMITCITSAFASAAEDSGALPARVLNGEFAYTGTVKGLAIVADFPDQPITKEEVDEISRTFNSRDMGEDGKVRSLHKYYDILSRGGLSFDVDVEGPIRLPEGCEHYYNAGFKKGSKNQQVSLGRYQALEYCLKHLISSGFDFSRYTRSLGRNEGEELAYLCFVLTARGPERRPGKQGPTLFNSSVTSLRWGGVAPVAAPGVKFDTFFGAGSLYTMVHETAHRILGWPDLYGVRFSIGPATGVDGIMSGQMNKNPDPYHMYQRGWLEAQNLFGKSGSFSIGTGDLHVAYAYYDPKNPDEYFLIQPLVRSGPFENELPEEGLAIWRVYTKGVNNQFPAEPLQVELVHANGVNASFGKSGILFKAGAYDAYGADTVPSSRWKYGEKAGMDSGLDISGISAVGSTMSFTLNRRTRKTDRVIHRQYSPPDKDGWIPTAVCSLPLRSLRGFKEISREAVYRIPTPRDLRSSMRQSFFLSGYETPIDYCVWPAPRKSGGKPEVIIRFNRVRQMKFVEAYNYSGVAWAENNMNELTAWVSSDESNWRKVGKVDKMSENRWLLTLPDWTSSRLLRLGIESGKNMMLSQVYVYGK